MSTASDQAARNRLMAANMGPSDIAERNATNAINAARGTPARPNQWQAVRVNGSYQAPAVIRAQPSQAEVSRYRTNTINQTAAAQSAARRPTTTNLPRVGSSGSGGGGGGGRGGGGGGGGAAAPVMSQGLLDWMTGLLGGARPQAQTATTLDLPDYAGMAMRAFDPTTFNTARTALGQGITQDTATANQATADMLGFLNNNYSNAFNNANNTYATAGQAPGMDQMAMARMLQSQGVNPATMGPTVGQGVQADQAFGNMWRAMAGNEDIAQRGRLANAQQYGNQAVQGITAAGRAGNLGIDLGQGQAQAAWQKAADDRAYQDYGIQQQLAQQEALQNWQRANEVSDVNTQATNAYRNSELASLLGLLPQLMGNSALNLPSLQALGLG